MNEQLARQLVKSRSSVRKKYQALKNAEFESQSKLEEAYKPIIQPLQEIISNIAKIEPLDIKEEPLFSNYYQTSTPQKTRKIITKTGKTPMLPTEQPSFFDTSIASLSRIPNISQTSIASTSRIPNIQETSIIAETTPTRSSNNSTSLDVTLGNLSDILEQTRQSIRTHVGTPAYQQWLTAFHILPRTYIDDGVKDLEHKFDHHYGIVHDLETEKFYLGLTGETIEIIGKDIKIKNITYPGTTGLYELLFKKQPMGYKNEDLENYMDILARTNAYRRNNEPDGQVQGNGSHKYVTIIGPYLQKKGVTKTKTFNPPAQNLIPIFTRRKAPYRVQRAASNIQGSGLTLKVNKPNTDYVYWDNANELVDRLRLLVASMNAGHTGHNNEIISIIEELKEANIII
jgi:hypothetical protein